MRLIVEHLGADVERGVPESVRPCPVTFHLPSYQVAVIEALARRNGVDADTFLSDHLLDLAASHAEELAEEIPDLAAAIAFPDEVA